ncbi:MAG: leucine-rich repeat domain-containing protein [Treponema sp.]|jgi:hypothetical protein|nr:leucine-rich repeat domain-containing protein [Treponema sp.]
MYKTALAVFLSFISVCAYSQTVAFSTEVNLDGKGITIVGFKGNAAEIVIPRTIDGLPVTAIGEFAFDSRGLTKLVLPEGLESIGFFAFPGNELKTLIIPNTVTTIDGGAFANNQLESVVLSDNLIKISSIAFEGNKLRNIILPESLEIIGQLTFASNQLSEIIVPDNVIDIQSGAFADNELRNIVLPKRLKHLYTNIYDENYLTSIIIPDNIVAVFGELSPRKNTITSVTIGENVELHLNEDNPFDMSFYNFYTENGSRKGTYKFSNDKWTILTDGNMKGE